MRNLLAAAFVLASSSAFAQQPPALSTPPTYQLTIESKDLALLGKGLSALPYSDVVVLLGSLQNQVNAQNEKWAKEHITPAPKEDKKK